MNKKKLFKRLAVAGAVVAIVGLSATVGTMAKYITEKEYSASLKTGQWSVKFDEQTALTLGVKDVTTVSDGVVVPGTSGSVTVTATCTVDVDGTITATWTPTEALPTGMEVSLDSSNPTTITKSASEQTLTFKLNWSWDYGEDRVDNSYANKTYNGTLSITVTQVDPA